MPQLAQGQRLVLKLSARGKELSFTGQRVGVQLLDRPLPVEQGILSEVDGSHASLTEYRLDVVPFFDQLSDFKRHGSSFR